MDLGGWVYIISTFALFIAFLYIVTRYYGADRKKTEEAECPKYRMLEDDDTRAGK